MMRRMSRRLIPVLVCLPALFSATVRAADRTGTVMVARQTRSFLAHVPDGAPPPGGFPLLLVFHGGGMQGAGMRRVTGLDALADEDRFIVVYPDGIDRHWNDGRSTIRNPQDDVGFVSVLLDGLERSERVDAKRVFATGLSNGALFAERLGCDLSQRIAAIAPVAGTLPVDTAARCRPTRPVAVLQIDGTADPIMPYDGGAVADFGGAGEGGQVMSVDQTTRFWAGKDRCDLRLSSETLPAVAPGDPTRIRRLRFQTCSPAAPVILLAVLGGGHDWPGGAQPVRPRITGQPSRQIDASATIARFFLSLPPRP